MFDHSSIDFETLKKRAHNGRWANVPDGVIPLTAADPDFPCAPEITEAVSRFMKSRYMSYGPAEGLPEFRESVAWHYQSKRNIPADPECVLAVDSAASGLLYTCRAFLFPGEEAIIFDPVDFLFTRAIEEAGGVPISFSIPPGASQVDLHRIEACISPRTRLLCLCNPLNPTGKVFSRQELEILGEIACRHNLIILSDEIWSDIVYEPNRFVSIASIDPEIANRTVTVTGFSKAYGLAGLRTGAVMVSNIDHFNKLLAASLHRTTLHGSNILSQVAAAAALDHCSYWLDHFLHHLHRMRKLCVQELNSMPGFVCHPPEGCYVIFVNITGTGKSAREMHELLFDHAKVAVVPGLKEWFGKGAAGHIRISFATSEDILNEAFSRIRSTVGSNYAYN